MPIIAFINLSSIRGWCNLGWRAQLAGDVWPNPLAVFLKPQVSNFWVSEWSNSPGSPESQQNLAACRIMLSDALRRSMEAAFVVLPVVAAEHWTCLLLRRRAAPASQSSANRWEVCYKDSLAKPSQFCQLKFVHW